MNNTINNEFKIACKEFLSGLGIQMLRSYAREVGVFNPTKGKNKEDLIELIIGILMGEITPQEPSKRGAPIKNAFVDPKVHTGIEALKKQYLPD